MHNLAFAILAVATSLPAQDAWAAWQTRLRERGGAEVLLVLRPQDAQKGWWRRDDTIRRLVATREFRVEQLTESEGRDLSEKKSWKQDPHWLLWSADGLRQAEGKGQPDGDRLLTELRGLGFAPRWERREAFLKEHPEHGPARNEAVQEALFLSQSRMQSLDGGIDAFMTRLRTQPPDPNAVAQLDSIFREVAEALQSLARVPLWWEQEAFPFRRFPGMGGISLPPQMADAIVRLRDQAFEALQRDPGRSPLWNHWGSLATLTGQDIRRTCQSTVPAPGQTWPPETLVTILEESYSAKDDWAGQLEALTVLRTAATQEPVNRNAWDEARYALALVEIHRARALAHLDRWEESASAVAEARFLSGQRWRYFLSLFLRGGIPKTLSERWTVFEPFLDGVPLPDPPMPPAPPLLRLLRLGAPKWAAAWSGLAQSSELAPWAPGELAIDTASQGLEQTLRERHGWMGPREGVPREGVPRWVLLSGDQMLASGESLPTPRELAQRLASLAPSFLQRLDRFLERHPFHRAARRLRMDLLRTRMPNRHLEPQLAEDARQLRARVKPGGGWTPDSALWQWSAQQVLPTLESDLEHWPDAADLWRSWIAWSSFHPQPPSALQLARRLPLYGVEASWSSRLPAEVHKAVAEELRGSGRFEDMRQWFQAAWDGVEKQTRRRGLRVPPWLRSQRLGIKESIVLPLREALVVLRRDAEVVALDREVAAWLGSTE